MDKEYWEKQLETAISAYETSEYDFYLMQEAVKNGAEPHHMILQRAINYDRLDLVEYFCFSPELPKHCNINYKHDYFGENGLFIYACSCNALETVKFMLRDKRVTHYFNIDTIKYRGFKEACLDYKPEMVKFLLDATETKEFCNIQNNDFGIIQEFDIEDRNHKIKFLKEIVEYLIMTLDFNIVQDMKKYIVKYKDMFKPIFEARELHESLSSNLGKNNKSVHKIKI